jgi:hypothetical protein
MKIGDLVACTYDPEDVGIITESYEVLCAHARTYKTVVTIKWSKFRMPTQEIVGEWGMNLLSSA